MPVNLSIKDVPDAVAEQLRQRAARHHRSLQGELMAIIEQVVAESSTPRAARAPDARPGGDAGAGTGRSWVQGWKTIEQLVAERKAAGWTPDPSLAHAPLGADIVRADRDAR
ncbi:MAG: Arc family DNA-binding protein [Rubrivivax sp.]